MGNLKVVHISDTPLAGSPVRICNALNMLGTVDARLIQFESDGYKKFGFKKDLVWNDDREVAVDLINGADVIHLHNYINLHTTKYDGVSFKALWDKGKPMVRQIHSNPGLISRMSGVSESDVLSCPIPKLLIGQYQERYYPNSLLVPNIVFDLDHDQPARDLNTLRIGYYPSTFRSSREVRWDTKGYTETIRVLKKFKKKADRRGLRVELDIMGDISHEECLRRKSFCHITIDDLVTGSYHQNTLESLMFGSAVLTFMDDRVVRTLQTISGRDDFPALNIRLEDAESVLLYLAERPAVVRKIGAQSRQWMKQYWRPEIMAQKFLTIYDEVIKNPRKKIQNRFDVSDEAQVFMNQTIFDVLWENRHSRWPKPLPKSILRSKAMVGSFLRMTGLRK